MQIYTTRIIPSTGATRRLHVDNNDNRVADSNDPVLVKFSENGWQPVEQLDGSVDRFTLEQDYGYWKDRQISHREGWPWNRRTVVDRPRDGKIDADELSFPEFQRFGGSQLFEVGSEIVADDAGRLTVEQHYHRFAPARIIGRGDIQWLSNYRADDANWVVPTS